MTEEEAKKMTFKRRPRPAALTGVLVTVALSLSGFDVAGAQQTSDGSNQGDSSAVAINRRDGSSVFRLAFSVKRVMSSEVDADNAAVAYASCTDCQTVASSIQVVLVMDDSNSLTTDNVAIAINYQCTECDTLAAAYQYVFGNGEPVRFTAEGNRKLADIRRRYQQLRQRDDLTLQQLADEIAKLAGEVAEVVDEELVATGKAGAPGQARDSETTTTTTTPANEDTATTTTAVSDGSGPTTTTATGGSTTTVATGTTPTTEGTTGTTTATTAGG